MKYISICSGIEAASVAFHGFGWTPLAFSEIEAFPSAVLAHHWPHVPNLGDMTKFAEWPEDILAECDLLVGGPPCQAFSVAGLRKSLDDDRGNITLAYVRLLNHIDEVRKRHGRPPAIAVYENVPGLLSTKDNAFGCLIGALAGCDEAPETETGKWPKAGYVCGETRRVGYRVIDAQYFGVAQRRRRIFLVAVPCELVERVGERLCPSEVLSLRESLLGNPPTRGEAKQAFAAGFATSPGVGGLAKPLGSHSLDKGRGTDLDNTTYVAFTQNQREEVRILDIAGACSAEPGSHQQTYVAQPAVAFDTTQVTSPKNYSNPKLGDPCHPLAARAHVPAIAFANRTREGVKVPEIMKDGVVPALTNPGEGGRADAVNVCLPTPIQEVGKRTGKSTDDPRAGVGIGNTGDPMFTMQAHAQHGVHSAMQVRRLTPKECEYLQGFPADHTNVTYRNKPAADGPRYRALGNSMAVPCMVWLGYRISKATKGDTT